MRKFRRKELAFIYWRARGFSLVESVLKAGYKVKSRIVASRIGYNNIQKEDIKVAIEQEKMEIFDTTMITTEFVLTNLREIAQNAKTELNRVRANELLGKYLAMFTDKQEFKATIEYTQAQKDEYKRLTGRELNSLIN